MPNSLTLWQQWLMEMLCRAYQALGGNCVGFTTPADAISDIAEVYQSSGAPEFEDDADRLAYLKLLTAIKAHLSLSDNDIDTYYNDMLLGVIQNLEQDLAEPE